MYIGDNMEAIPTPTPAIRRAIRKIFNAGANAIANDEIRKTDAAIKSPRLLPYLSETFPASKHPAIAPSAKVPVANPSQYSFNPNCSLKKGNAPEITAKSNPNKYPPSADMNEMDKI